MPKYLNTPIIRLIIVTLWIVLIPLTVIWIITGGGPEAWVFLISGLAIPLAIWVQSRLTHSYDPSEMKDKSRQYQVSLRERLQKDPGIRNFVPLHIQKNPDQPQIKTIADAYDQLNRFVIVGKAGTGKTTLLRWLTLQTLSQSLDNGELLQTVIWLDLSEWADTETLETFVCRQWLRIDKPLEVVAQQNSTVFLDGLDELGPKGHKKLQQLDNWLTTPFQVVATCRTENFASLNLNLQTVELAPELNDIQICKFANSYLREDAEQFLALIMLDTPECYETGDNDFIPDQVYLNRLHELLDAQFDQEELRTLCFNLGVDFDSLRGEGKTSKARELILVLNRNGRLSELMSEVSTAKPLVLLPDYTQPKNSKELPEKLQAISDRYLDGKDLRLLIKIITETQERNTDRWTHLDNIYQPFTKTPFQIATLFQYYQKQIDRGELPLNLGRVTDTITRAIWSREQERRTSTWISYEALTTILSQFAYSRIGGSYESDCQTQEGWPLAQAAYTLNSSFDQAQYNQRNRYKKALVVGSKWLFLPIWFPIFVLVILLKLIGDFVFYRVIYKFKLFWPVANKLSDYQHHKREKSEQATLRQAQPLLRIFESAGLLRIVEEIWPYVGTPSKCVHFTDTCYLDYFAAHAFMGSRPEPIFTEGSFGRYQAGWRRMMNYWDRIFIALSGLVENPKELVSELASIRKDSTKGIYEYDNSKPSDYYLAAKCILSLGPRCFETAFLGKLTDCLVKTMQDVQNAGEERSVDCAEVLYFLADTSTIPAMISTIEELKINTYRFAIAKTIARFGKDAIPTLLSKLDPTQRETYPSLVRAIGRIGDSRTQEDLIKALRAIEPSDTWLYAPTLTALVRVGNREATNELMDYVSKNVHKSNVLQLKNWLYDADLDADIIPYFVNILRDQTNEHVSKFIEMMVFAFGTKASPTLIDLLNNLAQEPPEQPYALTAVIEALSNLGEKRALGIIRKLLDAWENEMVCLSAIEAVGRLNDQKATGKLIALTSYSKAGSEYAVWIRASSAEALGQIGSPKAIRALELLLNDHNPVFVGEKKEVCAFAADALRAINTTESRALALAWYKNRLYSTPPNSREASHAYLGLVNIATDEARAIINQWESSK